MSYNQSALSYVQSYSADALGYPFYHSKRNELFPGCPDPRLALILPIIIYWVVSLSYHALDHSGWEWIDKYRVQPAEDADKKNLVTKSEVIRTVLKMQGIQALLGAIWQIFFKNKNVVIKYTNHTVEVQKVGAIVAKWLVKAAGENTASDIMATHGEQLTYYVYWWAGPIVRLVIGAIILDTYQYWVHRLFHTIPFLYKHVHAVHHRLYVPYAYGSHYNHPVEGGAADALSGILATNLSRMYEREVVLLLAIVAYKSVEDHCGYQWTKHPLRWLSKNDAEFHEIHHQVAGLKYNFSQPLFVMWDKAMGTYLSKEGLEQKKAARKIKKN